MLHPQTELGSYDWLQAVSPPAMKSAQTKLVHRNSNAANFTKILEYRPAITASVI
jgi:hypothetical protein